MNKISPTIIEQFKNIVGEPYLFTDRESIEKYGKDSVINIQTGEVTNKQE